MVETENKVIQCRRDTAANWASNNPVPKAGEWCYETDTKIAKIGDGSTNYNSLPKYEKTDATKAELDKLHNLSTTKTELGYVHGVTSAIQTQLNAKFAKADIQTSFGETLSDEKVASEKLVKSTFDTKQNGITLANDSGLKASVVSAMSIIGENNSGRRYDEPKTLAKMISAAHSTFDLSKFTVAGTPTITADGIASGFSNINRIYVSNIEFLKGDNWKIYCPLPKGQTGIAGLFVITGTCIQIVYTPEKKTINYNLSSTGSTWDIANGQSFIASNLDITKEALYVLEFTGTQYKSYILQNNQIVGSATDITNSNKLYYDNTTIFILGNNRNANAPTNGSIDLKQFSITVDGKEVFNGNKEGLDVIKPNDYMVVGSPIITDDGVASGFSSSNYITTPTMNFGTNWVLEIEFIINSYSTIQQIFRGLSGNSFWGQIYIDTNGRIMVEFTGLSTYGLTPSDEPITLGSKYKIRIVQQSEVLSSYLSKDDSEYVRVNNQPTQIALTNNVYFRFGYGYNENYILNAGSINLNAFKIYVEGDLVYQPCLKIPYTLAANDKKFISPIYEDRAKDMAEQFGVAPYYILDEDNGNFAMPYGSVEEKIAPKIVVGHYEDGASAWEQYLDRTMIQRGTTVADTDVTFPCSDEYADINFTLSCPFSAKTTTGFTPSASGTYIAIGKF